MEDSDRIFLSQWRSRSDARRRACPPNRIATILLPRAIRAIYFSFVAAVENKEVAHAIKKREHQNGKTERAHAKSSMLTKERIEKSSHLQPKPEQREEQRRAHR